MQALASRLWTPRRAPPPRAARLVGGVRRARGARPRPGLRASTVPGPGSSRRDWLEVCGADPEAVRAVVAAALEECDGEVTASTLETEDVVAGGARRRRVRRGRGAVVHPPPPRPRRPAARALPEGYAVRAVRPGEHEQRVGRPPRRLVGDLDGDRDGLRAADGDRRPTGRRPTTSSSPTTGEWVASCCVWLGRGDGRRARRARRLRRGARRRGLASAASVSALTAARELGATDGLVCPRGDDDYPAPARLYRRIGFVPGARTRTYRRSAEEVSSSPSSSRSTSASSV